MSELSQQSFDSSPQSSTPTPEDRLARQVESRYPEDPDLQQHVLESARRAGTVDRIVSGELSLPHPQDARRDLERVQRQERENRR
jgi:hypothetical protein